MRWLRRLRHHPNAFGCKKLRSTVHPAVAVWDSWAPSSQKLFSSPFLHSVSNERFPGSCLLHQQSFWLLTFDRIEQIILPVLCCHLSVLLIVVRSSAHLQPGFCLQKTFCASQRLVPLTLHHLQRPAEVFSVLWWNCHRVKHKKMTYLSPRDIPCFHFHDKVHKHLFECHASTLHWGHCKAMPLQVRMEEGPRSKAVCVSGLQYCQCN